MAAMESSTPAPMRQQHFLTTVVRAALSLAMADTASVERASDVIGWAVSALLAIPTATSGYSIPIYQKYSFLFEELFRSSSNKIKNKNKKTLTSLPLASAYCSELVYGFQITCQALAGLRTPQLFNIALDCAGRASRGGGSLQVLRSAVARPELDEWRSLLLRSLVR